MSERIYRVTIQSIVLADDPVLAAKKAWDIFTSRPYGLPICEVIETCNINEPENDNTGQVCVDLNDLDWSRKAIEQAKVEGSL